MIEEVRNFTVTLPRTRALRFDSAPKELYLRADRTRLRQVLANLVDNAINTPLAVEGSI